jgi:hypothetical protein
MYGRQGPIYIGIIRKYGREDTSCSPNYSMETLSGAFKYCTFPGGQQHIKG